jgi:uncharacterized protein (DUF1778 family)
MSRACRAEAPARMVGVRLSPRELALAVEAAQINRQVVGDFIRDAILEAAADCLESVHRRRQRPARRRDS